MVLTANGGESKLSDEPPTEEITYGSSFTFYTEVIPIDDNNEVYLSLVLPSHPKAKQLDSSKGHEWLQNYVYKKLHASGVFYEDDINPANPFGITSHIVMEATRCGTTDFGQGMPCIKTADFLIEQAIRYPPPPINEKHFSLRAFAQLKK